MQSRDRTELDLKDLLQNSGEWTLADDNKVCSALANLAENIENRGNSLEKSLNNLLVRTGKLDAAVQYLNIEISVLKNSKFIEVSIDDDDPRMRRSPAVVSTKSVAEQRCEVIDAVKRCVNDSLGYSATNFAQPRADMDLPPLIGSKEFTDYGMQPFVDNSPPMYEHYGSISPPALSPPENLSDSDEKETISSNEHRNVTNSRISPVPLAADTDANIKPNIPSTAGGSIEHQPSPPFNVDDSTGIGAPPIQTPVEYPVQPSSTKEPMAKERLFSDDSSESEADISQSRNGEIVDNVVKTNGLFFDRDETTGPNIRPPTSAQLASAVSNLRSVPSTNKEIGSVTSTDTIKNAPFTADRKDIAPSHIMNGNKCSVTEGSTLPKPKEEPIVPKAIPVVSVPTKKLIGKSLFDDSDSDEDLFKPVFQKPSRERTVVPVKTPPPEPVQQKVEPPVIEKATPSAPKSTTIAARADKYKKLFDSDSEGEDLFKSLKAGSSLKNHSTPAVLANITTAASTTDASAREEASSTSEEMSSSKKTPGRLSSSAFANALNSKLAGGPPPSRNTTAPVRNSDVTFVPEKIVKSTDGSTKPLLSAPTLSRARPPKNRKPPSRYSHKSDDEPSEVVKNLEKIVIDGPENGNKSEPLLRKKSEEKVTTSVQVAKKADPVVVKSTVATSKAVKSLFDSDDDDDNCAIFK